jgi:ATP-dependent Lon protease
MSKGLRRSPRIRRAAGAINYGKKLMSQFLDFTKANSTTFKDIYDANCSIENKILAFGKSFELSQTSIDDASFVPTMMEIKRLLKEDPKELIIPETIDAASKKQIAIWNEQKNSLGDSQEKVSLLMQKINCAMKLPYNNVVSNVNCDYNFATSYIGKINEKLHSMEKIKTQLLQSIFSKSSSQVLAFSGPPGIGKTQICRAHAYACGLPISFINIGALKDATSLKGSLGVWVGSEPGAITKALMSMGVANGIIVFDEIDKIDPKNSHAVYTTLLEILDPSQNKNFTDEFLPGINIDLSKVTFLCTMNDETAVNPILLDRIKVIPCDNYTVTEKINIIRKHFIPIFSNEIGLHNAIAISDHVAILAINGTAKINSSHKVEPGVRLIQKIIKSALEWLNFISKVFTTKDEFEMLIGTAYKKYPTDNKFEITEGLINAIIDNLSNKGNNCDNVSHFYL